MPLYHLQGATWLRQMTHNNVFTHASLCAQLIIFHPRLCCDFTPGFLQQRPSFRIIMLSGEHKKSARRLGNNIQVEIIKINIPKMSNSTCLLNKYLMKCFLLWLVERRKISGLVFVRFMAFGLLFVKNSAKSLVELKSWENLFLKFMQDQVSSSYWCCKSCELSKNRNLFRKSWQK